LSPGETATQVQVGGTGRPLPAKVVVFDEKNDIAVLRVNGLGLTPLHLAAPRPGKVAAVIGFPENGPLDIEPARTGPTQRVVSTIFASRTGSDNLGYGIPARIVHRHLRVAAERTTPVSTKGCAN
jgi:S1-C subfamily serine protease